ncbi:MAG: protein phosphatase 2C domain-containing protein [Planctomycetales bacterium]|nr:protein phosphatase 2C domain-containing protein [Planctomycetales bacterium]
MFSQAKIFWLAKDAAHAEQYQDAFALDERRGVAAIADGVSSSLFSAQWAKIITQGVIAAPPDVRDPASLFPWLAAQRKAWNAQVDTDNLAWHQKAKLQQGAQATLLWVEVTPAAAGRARLKAFAVGDCLLFHARGSQNLRAFPIESSQLLENNPHALCSIESKNDQTLPFQVLEEDCQPGDLLVLCTDAVAAWALKALEEGATLLWRDFWNLSPDDWAEYVGRLRQEQRMRYDDATLMLLRVGDPAKARPGAGQLLADAKRKVHDVTDTVAESLSDFFGGFSSKRKGR